MLTTNPCNRCTDSGEILNERTTLSPNAESLAILSRLRQGGTVQLTAEEGQNLADTVDLASLATRVARSALKNIINRSNPDRHTSEGA